MFKLASRVICVALWGLITWALDHFLWDWFTHYLETDWHIEEVRLMAHLSSGGVATLVVGATYWLAWTSLRMSIKRVSATQPQPDMPIADAFNYIVNDSATELRLPRPRERFTKGRLGKWPSAGHNAAWSLVSAQLASGDISIWGIRDRIQIGAASLPSPDGVMRSIPKDYWEYASLRRPACFKNDDKEWQTDSRRSKDYRYTNLRVSSKEIRSHWHPAAWWKRKMADWRGQVRRDYWAVPVDKRYRRIGEGDHAS
jgi:hypothetical protein